MMIRGRTPVCSHDHRDMFPCGIFNYRRWNDEAGRDIDGKSGAHINVYGRVGGELIVWAALLKIEDDKHCCRWCGRQLSCSTEMFVVIIIEH